MQQCPIVKGMSARKNDSSTSNCLFDLVDKVDSAAPLLWWSPLTIGSWCTTIPKPLHVLRTLSASARFEGSRSERKATSRCWVLELHVPVLCRGHAKQALFVCHLHQAFLCSSKNQNWSRYVLHSHESSLDGHLVGHDVWHKSFVRLMRQIVLLDFLRSWHLWHMLGLGLSLTFCFQFHFSTMGSQQCLFFPSIASWLSPGRSTRYCMKWINCNYWAVLQKPTRRIHGPKSEKAGIRTGFAVLGVIRVPKTGNKTKTGSNNRKSKQTKQQKNPHRVNRHCEKCQLSWGKVMAYTSQWSRQYGVKH